MLQTRKNVVLTSAAIKQMNVRNRELQFYMNSYWVWGSCCTVMEGFVFGQLVTPVPPGTELWLEVIYLTCITICGGLNLYIITVTTLCCIWGPAMAIRGEGGLRSVHRACDFMKDEQNWVYGAFLLSIISYFGFNMCLLSIWGWNSTIAVICNVTFTIFLIMLLYLLYGLEKEVGSNMLFEHSGAEGRIKMLDILQDLADFDHNVHSRVPDVEPPSFAGMRDLFRRPKPEDSRNVEHLPRQEYLTRHQAEVDAWKDVERVPTAQDYSRRRTIGPGEQVSADFARIGDFNPEDRGEDAGGAEVLGVSEAPGDARSEASDCRWFTRVPSPDS